MLDHWKVFNVLNVNTDYINLHPMKVYKSSLFFTFLPIFVLPCLFDDSYSDRYEVIAHYFDVHFPVIDVEQCFMYLLTSISRLWKSLFSPFPTHEKNGFVLGYS